MTSRGPSPSGGMPEKGSRLRAACGWVLAAHRSVFGALAWGAVLTLCQLAFVYSQTYEQSVAFTYFKLFQHDSYWYKNIAEEGYVTSTPPGEKDMSRDNVAFFPGFPVTARLLGHAFGLSGTAAVLLAGQLACWGFWTYFLLLLRRWQVSAVATAFAVSLVAAHPCAFYLVAGYSESLFMMTLLGYLYWAGNDGFKPLWLAAAHGFVMTATRIVGIPIAFAPGFLVLGRGGGDTGSPRAWPSCRSPLRVLLLAATASLGGLLFFGYCHWRFGSWDLYMQTQRNGWGLKPNYLAVFKPEVYEVFMPRFGVDGFVEPRDLSRLAVPLTLTLLCGVLAAEAWAAWRHNDGRWRVRAPLHFAAWAMFYISVCGLVAVRMNSMIRYVLPVHALLVLIAADLCTKRPPRGLAGDASLGLLVFVVINSISLQAVLAHHFAIGHWVA